MVNKVLESLLKIQRWKVVSYKTLWNHFWIHPRVVAQILSKNTEQDKYPCYKVINSDWKIWWYNLWIYEKVKRLKGDWVKVNDLKVKKEFFQESMN